MELVWTTDTHLNMINNASIKHFCHKILDYQPCGVVITGDISHSDQGIETHVRLLEKYLGGNIPIYFVCGNHDYYDSSIVDTRKMLKQKFGSKSMSRWLPNFKFISLSDKTALVGHDGWYDGRYGDYFESMLDLNDYHCIKELIGGFFHRPVQYETIGKLATEGSVHVADGIKKAFETHTTVYVATHVAPFMENSRAPDGKMSDKHWMPHFSSKIMGDAILETMKDYNDDHKLIVLNGHNHTFYDNVISNNIRCITGGAKYYTPAVCDSFQI